MNREPIRAGILLIGDDPATRQAIPLALVVERFQVYQARTFWAGLRLLRGHQPDLVLLSALLPDSDGWEACAQIRARSEAPIILIGGTTAEDAVIRAFDLGADDYVARPVRPREVLARVRAVLRRYRRSREEPEQPNRLTYDRGRLVLDLDHQEVQVEGQSVALTATEFRLLTYLAINRGHLLSHRQILEQVWGPGYVDQVDYVKVYIRSLRNKIEPVAREPRYIISRRGLGYRFAAEPAEPIAPPTHPTDGQAVMARRQA